MDSEPLRCSAAYTTALYKVDFTCSPVIYLAMIYRIVAVLVGRDGSTTSSQVYSGRKRATLYLTSLYGDL